MRLTFRVKIGVLHNFTIQPRLNTLVQAGLCSRTSDVAVPYWPRAHDTKGVCDEVAVTETLVAAENFGVSVIPVTAADASPDAIQRDFYTALVGLRHIRGYPIMNT